jgi:hypothetical protein
MPFQRLTERREGKAFINTEILQREETGFTGEAAERLAAFEDVYEHLLQSQETLSAKLEELRSEGKTRSHQFKEAMGKKLMNTMILSLLESRGIR